MKIDEVVLGELYEDEISGFKGIATSKHTYINGCQQVGLTSKVKKDDDGHKVYSYDVERLKRKGKGLSERFKPEKLTEPGGPGDHAAARSPQHG